MVDYLERYRAGEHVQVWQELVDLGAAIREEPLASAARAVAEEMLQRARHNVDLIDQRLRSLGFRFMSEHPEEGARQTIQIAHENLRQLERLLKEQPNPPDPLIQPVVDMVRNRPLADMVRAIEEQQSQISPQAGGWFPPTPDLSADVAELDSTICPLPLVLRVWFEVVGSVNLMGDHPRLSCYYRDEGPPSDPLVVEYGGDWLRDSIANENYLDEDGESDDEAAPMYEFEIAPDACHKANMSGGGPTYFRVPNMAFDAPLVSDDEWDGMYFIAYLRVCFERGGFPGLDATAAAAAREELARLTEGLLPL